MHSHPPTNFDWHVAPALGIFEAAFKARWVTRLRLSGEVHKVVGAGTQVAALMGRQRSDEPYAREADTDQTPERAAGHGLDARATSPVAWENLVFRDSG